MLLFTIGATFLYFAQSDLVGRAYADRATRTAVLAQLELAVQTLTVLTQIFFTGRIIRWLGLAAALAVLPVLSIVGFAALGAFPVFAMVAVFTVLRRGGNFAVTNPAMEVLFTVVKREDKYKAKNVIETVVYRSGDQIGGWAYRGLAALGIDPRRHFVRGHPALGGLSRARPLAGLAPGGAGARRYARRIASGRRPRHDMRNRS